MELTEFLKSQGARAGHRGHSRVQSGLIVAQTAMVVVLLAGGRTADSQLYQCRESVDTGFSQSTVTFHLALDERYKPQQIRAFYRSLMAKLEALPGVQAAGAVNHYRSAIPKAVGIILGRWYPNKDFQSAEARAVTPGLLCRDEYSADRRTLLQ